MSEEKVPASLSSVRATLLIFPEVVAAFEGQ